MFALFRVDPVAFSIIVLFTGLPFVVKTWREAKFLNLATPETDLFKALLLLSGLGEKPVPRRFLSGRPEER